jgi:hypothetical protein
MAARYRGIREGHWGHTARVVAVLALVVGTVWAALTWAGDHGREIINAGAWWWGWLALPVVAALLAALVRRRGRGPEPWLLTVALLAPMAVGFVAHDRMRDRQPAYWPVGWTLLVVLGVICTAAGLSRRSSR